MFFGRDLSHIKEDTAIKCLSMSILHVRDSWPFSHLTLNTLSKLSADDILKYLSYFSQKTGFDISCKLSPQETICMKCQILFPGKN